MPSAPDHALPSSPPSTAEGERVRSNDGRELCLRAIEADDVAALQRCFGRLSPLEVRRRFGYAISELSAQIARRLCEIDPVRETAFVLIDETSQPNEMRGVGRLHVDEYTDTAEFSVLVEQDWTRLGLGALLMQRLVDDGRRRRLHEIWGHVLMENRPMLQLCRELGFVRRTAVGEPGTALISLRLH